MKLLIALVLTGVLQFHSVPVENVQPIVEAATYVQEVKPERVEKKKPAKKRVPTSLPQRVGKPILPQGDWVAQCHKWAKQAGITLPPAAIQLIDKESDCNPNAVNPTSGACGIGQQYPCGKWPHKWNDPVGGLKDMYNYTMNRYGSWEAALAYHLGHNSY